MESYFESARVYARRTFRMVVPTVAREQITRELGHRIPINGQFDKDILPVNLC